MQGYSVLGAGPAALAIDREVNNQVVSCQFSTSCEAKGAFNNGAFWKKHAAECIWRKSTCPMCWEHVAEKDFVVHLKQHSKQDENERVPKIRKLNP